MIKKEREALDEVLDMAIENSCSCGDEEYSDRKGYQGHATDCHVHRHRAALKRVAAMLAPAGKEVAECHR